MPHCTVNSLIHYYYRKSSCEDQPKSLSANSREGSFEEDIDIDLNQFDILRFLEGEENCGFDQICLEKLNISPDFMVNLIQVKGTY